MTTEERPLERPGEARRVMDDLEAAIAAEATERAPAGEVKGHDSWVPEVPGSDEPPD